MKRYLIAPVSAVVVVLGFMTTNVMAASSTEQSAASVAKHHRPLARGELAHAFGSTGSLYNSVAPRAEPWQAYQIPIDANGNVINPTDYQRGGTN
jgi:hypothetical protein